MGAAYDLSEFVKNDPRWKDGSGYYPTMMKLGNFNGKQYAVPFAISTPIVYFNETLLKKAGIDTSKGFETWPALIEAAKKVQALGPEYSGLFYEGLDSSAGRAGLYFGPRGFLCGFDFVVERRAG